MSKMRTLAQSPAMSPMHYEEDKGAVHTRDTQLKMPRVEVSKPCHHHDGNTALPLALRTVSRLVKEAGLLPG